MLVKMISVSPSVSGYIVFVGGGLFVLFIVSCSI